MATFRDITEKPRGAYFQSYVSGQLATSPNKLLICQHSGTGSNDPETPTLINRLMPGVEFECPGLQPGFRAVYFNAWLRS